MQALLYHGLITSNYKDKTMSLENKINAFLTDSYSRFSYVDQATTGAVNAAQGHMDNLYDTHAEAGVDASGEDFLSDYYVAGILDRVADELSSMYDVDAKDNTFWVELKAIVKSSNKN
jgi:hypothetical protein